MVAGSNYLHSHFNLLIWESMYDPGQQVNSLPKLSLDRWQHWSRFQFPKTPGNIWCKTQTTSHKQVRALCTTVLWPLWHHLLSLAIQGTEFLAFSIKNRHFINKTCFLWNTKNQEKSYFYLIHSGHYKYALPLFNNSSNISL